MVEVFPQMIELNPVERDCCITIRNTSTSRIVYKIKSNNIEYLQLSKSFGYIASKEQMILQIKILGESVQTKKLLIESIKLLQNQTIDYKNFDKAGRNRQQSFIKIHHHSSFLSDITFKKISFKQTLKFLLILLIIVGIIFIIHKIDSIPEQCL